MSRSALDVLAVYADIIPLRRFVTIQPHNLFVVLLPCLFVVCKHKVAFSDLLYSFITRRCKHWRPRSKALRSVFVRYRPRYANKQSYSVTRYGYTVIQPFAHPRVLYPVPIAQPFLYLSARKRTRAYPRYYPGKAEYGR